MYYKIIFLIIIIFFKLYIVCLGPTCRKEQTREYYAENGCRSRKPVKLARCEGSCGSSCCRARKTKRRKVRLICNDGTRYTKDVDIVRKCACTKKCYWLSGPSYTHVALPPTRLNGDAPMDSIVADGYGSCFIKIGVFYFVNISIFSALFIIISWSLCICLFLVMPWKPRSFFCLPTSMWPVCECVHTLSSFPVVAPYLRTPNHNTCRAVQLPVLGSKFWGSLPLPLCHSSVPQGSLNFNKCNISFLVLQNVDNDRGVGEDNVVRITKNFNFKGTLHLKQASCCYSIIRQNFFALFWIHAHEDFFLLKHQNAE